MCPCVHVCPSGLCLLPFLLKAEWSCVLCDVLQSLFCRCDELGAARRGVRTASGCSSFKGRSLGPCFFKTGNRKEAFESKEALPFTLALCVVLRRHSPDCYTHHE